MRVIKLKQFHYIFKGNKSDYRLRIYIDGYRVETGYYLSVGNKGYIWETEGGIILSENKKIVRSKKNIDHIIFELAKEIKIIDAS